MIPNIQMNHGRKLTDQEANQLFEQVKPKERFQKIGTEISKFKSFDQDYVTIVAANVVEFVNNENELIKVKVLVVRSDDTLIYYQKTDTDITSKEEFIGGALVSDEFLNFFFEEGVIVKSSSDYDDQLDKDYSEGLPNDPNYQEADALNTVSPMYEWGDGCYPLYRHCGRNCGDNGNWGGGTPINVYDSCCRTHDRCWANFGTNDCGCDCNLLACARRNWAVAPVPLHLAVLAIFPISSSCSC